MQYLHQRYIVLITLFPIFTVLAIIVALFFNAQIVWAFQLHWLFLLAALLLVVIPKSCKYRLALNPDEKPLYSTRQWWLRILGLQLSFLAIFLGMATFINIALPTTPSPFNPHSFSHSLSFMYLHLGLFPWPLVAILACAFANTAYRHNQDAYISTLVIPIIGDRNERTLGNILDYDTRFATGGALATTIAFITLIIAFLFTQLLNHSLLWGFHHGTQAAAVLLVIITLTKPFHLLLKKLFSRKFSFGISLFLSVILLAILLVIFNRIFDRLNHYAIITPKIIEFLQQKNSDTLWMVFSLSWWVAWTPTASAYVAKISRGLNIRTLISGVISVPLLITMILLLSQHFYWLSIPWWLSFLCACIGFLGLALMITEKQIMLPALVLSYLPKATNIKSRGQHRFFRKIIMLSTFVIYLYIPAGLSTNAIFMFFTAYSFAVVSLLVLFALLKSLCSSDF